MEKTNAQPGDKINIHLPKTNYEGIFLESSSEEGIVLLKLESGYNIGFRKKEILKVEVVKKFEEKERKELDLKFSR